MSTGRWRVLAGALSVTFLACTLGPLRAGDDRGGEVGVLLGFTLPDEDTTGKFGETTDSEFSLGLRIGTVFRPRWGWYVDALQTRVDVAPALDPAGRLDETVLRSGFDLLFAPQHRARWFLTLGGVWTALDYKGLGDTDYVGASLGLGQRIALTGRRHFRWELRGDRSLDDEGPGLQGITQIRALFGLTWGPGSGDSDGDGIADGLDRCAPTPPGASVDATGCPLDTDGDNVPDGIDRCAATVSGAQVDADGCPRDDDGDDVPDGLDKCPRTISGTEVDASGCPRDDDGDDVPDGLDKCPRTISGTEVDASGCPRDDDGDDVPDGIDKCPRTVAGAQVDASGCPRDDDGDEVPDGIDKCPDTRGGTEVDATGCPRAMSEITDDMRQPLVLQGVLFGTNSAVLTPESLLILDRVARSVQDWPALRFEIGGHSDSTGNEPYNVLLSRRRAEAVREYLLSRAVDAGRVSVRGYGSSQPVADNASEAGRQQNRRVELKKLN